MCLARYVNNREIREDTPDMTSKEIIGHYNEGMITLFEAFIFARDNGFNPVLYGKRLVLYRKKG